MTDLVEFAGLLLTVAASGYALLAWLLRAPSYRARQTWAVGRPTISVLKPLYGFEARLEANLVSLARSAGDSVEILAGVRDSADPAAEVVRRVQAQFPRVAISLVIDPRVYGHNLKVSNLINLLQRATGEVLVIADSDILVADDYLDRVVAPLADDGVGLVTCLYRGRAAGGLTTRLGSLFVDTWFVPSVGVASRLGERSFGFGSTLALRRSTLDAIGGFHAVKDQLADDYWLAELIHRAGFKTVISDVVVETDVTERRFAALWQREVRWMRTIRSLNPIGFSMTFVTHTCAMLALGVMLDFSDINLGIAAVGLLARIALQRRASEKALWLMPLRDGLLFLEWAAALFGSNVIWRGQIVPVNTDKNFNPISAAQLPDEADVI
jgi:ceramide glucosyltransferase